MSEISVEAFLTVNWAVLTLRDFWLFFLMTDETKIIDFGNNELFDTHLSKEPLSGTS